MFKTKAPSAQDIQEKWYHIDARGLRLGRLATIAAEILLDKQNVLMREYLTPKIKLVVTNAAHIDATAKRRISDLHSRYSGYPGGLTVLTLDEMMKQNPGRVVELAIKRMLPKNRRGEAIYDNLYVYAEDNHEHGANQMTEVNVKEIKL